MKSIANLFLAFVLAGALCAGLTSCKETDPPEIILPGDGDSTDGENPGEGEDPAVDEDPGENPDDEGQGDEDENPLPLQSINIYEFDGHRITQMWELESIPRSLSSDLGFSVNYDFPNSKLSFNDVEIDWKKKELDYDTGSGEIDFDPRGCVSYLNFSWYTSNSGITFSSDTDYYETYHFTYDNRGHLVGWNSKVTEDYACYTFTKSVDRIYTVYETTTTLTWENDNLTKIERVIVKTCEDLVKEGTTVTTYTETYDVKYSETENSSRQFPLSLACFAIGHKQFNPMAVIGLCGLGPVNQPLNINGTYIDNKPVEWEVVTQEFPRGDADVIFKESFGDALYQYFYEK